MITKRVEKMAVELCVDGSVKQHPEAKTLSETRIDNQDIYIIGLDTDLYFLVVRLEYDIWSYRGTDHLEVNKAFAKYNSHFELKGNAWVVKIREEDGDELDQNAEIDLISVLKDVRLKLRKTGELRLLIA